MQLPLTLAWLVDAGHEIADAERFLAHLGSCLVADGLPLAGGALTLAVPDPLIAWRTWQWRAGSQEVIEALGFAGAGPPAVERLTSGDAGQHWLEGIAPEGVHKDSVGNGADGPQLAWLGARAFTESEHAMLSQAARFAAAPLSTLAVRSALKATLEAYLGRRTAARVLASPLRRDVGETIQAALLYADLRGFTEFSESQPPPAVIAALGAWFERIAGAVHAFDGEVLKFVGDGLLAIFPVGGAGLRAACEAALRAAAAARIGMTHLNQERATEGLPRLSFGVALHIGEMLWGNIGAADRLDFTAIGPSVNLVSRLQGLCRPLKQTVLVSGALAERSNAPLIPLGAHPLRGIAFPVAVFAVSEDWR